MIHVDLMYLSMISVLAPTFLGAVLFKRLPRELRILVVFIFAKIVMESIVYVTWQLGINNMPVFHLYTYIEFCCISLIYLSIFRSIRIVRYSIVALGFTFLVLSLYILRTFESLDSFNSLQKGMEHIMVLMYVILFLFLFSRRLAEERILLKPYFFLSCGFLIYFTVTFLVLLETEEYVNFNGFFNWSVHSVLNIFLNIVFFIVLWISGRMVKSKH